MKELLLPYRVCDARYHCVAAGINGSDFQVLFTTKRAVGSDCGGKRRWVRACVVRIDENGNESVIFVNKYRFDLCLNF